MGNALERALLIVGVTLIVVAFALGFLVAYLAL
jgi:hypothetical protein